MPKVDCKKFPYTKKGKADAKKEAAKRLAAKSRLDEKGKSSSKKRPKYTGSVPIVLEGINR